MRTRPETRPETKREAKPETKPRSRSFLSRGPDFCSSSRATFEKMPSSLPAGRQRGGTRQRPARATRWLTLLAIGGAFAAGCGEGRPPIFVGDGVDPNEGTDSGGPNSGTGSLLQEAGGPPSCDAGLQGNVCGCLDLSLLADAPNMYFMLDRSGSMTDSNKWLTIRTVIADVMHRIGPRAQFGAAVFPDPRAADSCAPGVQVMALTPGDAPAGTYGVATGTFTEATNYPASGGTPTAATVNALAPTLTALPGKTFVILATDGGPNCNATVTCDRSACISNIESDTGCAPDSGPDCCTAQPLDCLDSAATVKAITDLAAAGIATYVVGVPGSGPYAALLNQMALAGGTARATSPYYFPVDTADTAAFTATLSAVAAQITATCVLTLSQAPPDATQVNVYLDGAVVPADPTNGWTLSGATVTLEGTTCASVLAGTSLDLRIVAGCPTVLR